MSSGHLFLPLEAIEVVTRPPVCAAMIFSPDDSPQTTLKAGETFEATWTMEAGHPGDCYFYLSYDADPSNAVNFFKIAAIPGCGAPDGLNIPASVTTTVLLPPEVPACDHCVLRWEWTAHQQVVDIEFYVQCADVKITSTAGPTLPSPITAIAGIEHLPQDASGYRKVYNGQGPEEQYLIGPAGLLRNATAILTLSGMVASPNMPWERIFAVKTLAEPTLGSLVEAMVALAGQSEPFYVDTVCLCGSDWPRSALDFVAVFDVLGFCGWRRFRGAVWAGHPKGDGKLRLITFMTDDYPNSWTGEKEIQESVWYHIQVVFTPATGGVALQVDSQALDTGNVPVNMLAATNGPQIGVYSFDYATQSWPAELLMAQESDR
ncbi:unnamed protein product [Durusdinium trenchii]|uniref:Auxiliary Activity family 9 catalytic domain-containing protein n=1 Tax=Durusdinium trenchii TaxID=1381693 RepID=A0ABP0QRA4_9DINO